MTHKLGNIYNLKCDCCGYEEKEVYIKETNFVFLKINDSKYRSKKDLVFHSDAGKELDLCETCYEPIDSKMKSLEKMFKEKIKRNE